MNDIIKPKVSAAKRYRERHPERDKQQKHMQYCIRRIKEGYSPRILLPKTSIEGETIEAATRRFWLYMN